MDHVRYFGPERKSVMVTLKDSAPGGVRTVKVNLPPDPDLVDHMVLHGVGVNLGQSEAERVGKAFIIQVRQGVLQDACGACAMEVQASKVHDLRRVDEV